MPMPSLSPVQKLRPALAFLLALGATTAAAEQPIPDPDFLRDSAETQQYRLGRPVNLRFTPDGTKLFFLESGARDATRRLYVFETASGKTRELITPESLLSGAEEVLSREEKARRERLRLTAKGFASFDLSRDGATLTLPLSGKLFAYDVASSRTRLLDDGAKPVLDARLSPDGTRVAFVRDYDLYVRELSTGRETRLTQGGSETLQHGLAEFVAQEEMERFEGYWWSPDSRTIAYEEADHRGMERFSIADPAKPQQAADSFYYPRPGKANAKVRVGLVPVTGGATTWLRWDAATYPYLVRVEWEEPKAPLTLIVERRDQREQRILAAERDGSTRTLLTQQDRAWLDPDYTLVHWLPGGMHFLTASEDSGVAQLEIRDARGSNARTLGGSQSLWGHPKLLENGSVMMLATATPLEIELRRLTTADDPTAAPQRLAQGIGERSFVVASRSGHYAVTTATLDAPPETTVHAADGQKLGVLPSVAELPKVWPKPELTTVTVGEETFHAAVLKPRNFNAKKRYPVIDSVYGGPTSNMVLPTALAYLRDQWLADHGAIVVRIDNRGTPRRDHDWARAFKDDRGENGDALSIIVNDQADALKALAAKVPQMDVSRVGITGWSYGGTSSVAAVTLRPDVFKAAVAGAPVTDWQDYDTYYTERYLDTPETNAAGYAKSNLVARAGELTQPLLLIHGTGDDNVYFTHSLKLADALFRAGKPFEFLPLINFTHMVPEAVVQERLQGRIAEFLFRHLGGPQ